jgi:viroplasmin and RNaseH domain-containing protein
MSDSKAQCFFVVFEGKTPGIYSSWNDAGEEVLGWPNARFSKYNSYGHAWNAWDSHCKKKRSPFYQGGSLEYRIKIII